MFSARRTSTSFSRLASSRCAPLSSVCATMVMRAISSFSVGPTVSESILMARRRAREETRLRTPGLFSTYATSVCMFSRFLLWLGRRFNERIVRPANHVAQGGASGNHGVDGIFLLDAEVDQHGFRRFARGADGRQHFSALGDALSADAESIGERRKIGRDQRSGNVALVVEKFLPLTNHTEITVVDDGDLDVDFLLDDRRQFAHGHLESAIAHDDPDFGIGLGKFRANRGGKRKTHRAKPAGSD